VQEDSLEPGTCWTARFDGWNPHVPDSRQEKGKVGHKNIPLRLHGLEVQLGRNLSVDVSRAWGLCLEVSKPRCLLCFLPLGTGSAEKSRFKAINTRLGSGGRAKHGRTDRFDRVSDP
jgi:hypothetical protein